jgi:hypothetical protein
MPRNGDRRNAASSEQVVELTNKLDQFVLKVTDSNARTDESIKSMKDRLFGGEGHKGMIEYFNEQFVQIKADALTKAKDSDLKELTTAVTEKAKDSDLKDLRKDHDQLNNKVVWYTGILAAIQFLILIGATLFAAWHH